MTPQELKELIERTCREAGVRMNIRLLDDTQVKPGLITEGQWLINVEVFLPR